MRLLPPKELNSKVQDQKKSEIDAGLFLAKKVDALRESLADTQKLHDDSMLAMQEEYRQHSIEYASKKGNLDRDIKDAEEHLATARIPLDSEWAKVRSDSQANKDFEVLLDDLSVRLAKEQSENIALSQDLFKRQGEIVNLESKTKNYLDYAMKQKTQSDEIMSNARSYEAQAREDIEARIKKLEARESDISYRELDLENKKQAIVTQSQKLEKDRAHLEARQRALKSSLTK